jgi:hypothetical protein
MNLYQTVKEKGYISGFLIGAGKIIMAIISHSWLLFIHALYNIIKAIAKQYALKEHSGHYNTMFWSGMLVLLASTVYLTYSVYIFFFGSTSSYHMYIAIGIAAVTTYELVISVQGLRKAKKEKNVREETVKYINLASALISVSLTQTAILSFTNEGDMSKAYAVGDALFGMLALLIGILMLVRANSLETAA